MRIVRYGGIHIVVLSNVIAVINVLLIGLKLDGGIVSLRGVVLLSDGCEGS